MVKGRPRKTEQYNPTASDILISCSKIQETWDKKEKKRRARHLYANPLEVNVVKTFNIPEMLADEMNR